MIKTALVLTVILAAVLNTGFFLWVWWYGALHEWTTPVHWDTMNEHWIEGFLGHLLMLAIIPGGWIILKHWAEHHGA